MSTQALPAKRYTRDQIARRVGQDIPDGAYVNLGIGLPTMVADCLPKGREIILHLSLIHI